MDLIHSVRLVVPLRSPCTSRNTGPPLNQEKYATVVEKFLNPPEVADKKLANKTKVTVLHSSSKRILHAVTSVKQINMSTQVANIRLKCLFYLVRTTR
ncbi:uncharacterized protein PHALS_08809 [Plasmopara halstedii]|uniref:Uncharacterized protein n=1 Tax=Plasmopara halstedii TaxID=4781 RepID=A0A0N7L4I3_PLAHL|nr:uncharacterized protein PHALS_08809 [Plasmopara halstedii]CEG38755.1 hypothetical protein PHALS_08809 [Plasmopara halstedii]|eukprot:XP_024575124.1 hypothetical protein PHALS_08809 [Plasmopara halstedii]